MTAYTTIQIAAFLGVQHELVRDAAGVLFGRTRGVFGDGQRRAIIAKLAQWKRI